MKYKKNIAIIGSGISGLSAAYFLKDQCYITLYEKNERLGGHSRTISINNDINVDTGFIVLNDRNYPNLTNLFQRIGIDLIKTEMSFSISSNNGLLEWSGTSFNSLFAQRKNILNFSMLQGICNILKFNKSATLFVRKFPDITLGELILKMNLKSWFRDYYILPMGAAIWSCPYEKIMDFPAANFVNFLENHGLLSLHNRPQWYTLKNKSKNYVDLLTTLIEEKGKIIKNVTICSIKRGENGVTIKESNKEAVNYDEVIFACHPSEFLSFIEDITSLEKSILEKFSRQKNTAYTHCDERQMPQQKRCWSSWNYLYEKGLKDQNVSVTYWMNKLQHIDALYPLFVTLNPIREIPNDKIYDVYDFYHPIFDQRSITGQKEIDDIQGINKLWFCGAYLRNGEVATLNRTHRV